jgi:pSer/pThr/pTyr-binding forkhead associated (FHA) protein
MTTTTPPIGGSEKGPREQTCSNCGSALRKGELICSNCGAVQISSSAAAAAATNRLPNPTESFDSKRARVGSIAREFQRIKFTIDSHDLLLPTKARLVIGRNDPTSGARTADIDLTPYDGVQLGVSRQHLELTRRNDLIFIVDLGSTNKTMLNGQIVAPAIERILRDGDHLMIGHMPVSVRFINT